MFILTYPGGDAAWFADMAAVLEHPELRTQRLATVLCGSNLTGEQVARWLV